MGPVLKYGWYTQGRSVEGHSSSSYQLEIASWFGVCGFHYDDDDDVGGGGACVSERKDEVGWVNGLREDMGGVN